MTPRRRLLLPRRRFLTGLLAATAKPTLAGAIIRGTGVIGSSGPPNLSGIGPTSPLVPPGYPLQPGFTGITDSSQIGVSGNYQLTASTANTFILSIGNTVLDGAGFTVPFLRVTSGASNVTIKNIVTTSGAEIDAPSVTITNSNIVNSTQVYQVYYSLTINASNVTVTNCLLDGTYAQIDDQGLPTGVLSGLIFRKNIVQNCYDCGIEGLGSFDSSTFDTNAFINTHVCAVGGWYDTVRGTSPGFALTNCVFTNNIVNATNVGAPWDFGFNTQTTDAGAMANWGGAVGTGTPGNNKYGNTFSGTNFVAW